MLRIPSDIIDKFVAHLNKRKISTAQLDEYKKWLRYYLDFCDKCPVPTKKAERVQLFCEKLEGEETVGETTGMGSTYDFALF